MDHTQNIIQHRQQHRNNNNLDGIDGFIREIKSLEASLQPIQNTHPVIYKLWKEYLTLKKEELINLSSQLEKLLETCDKNEVSDISMPQICALYSLQSVYTTPR